MAANKHSVAEPQNEHLHWLRLRQAYAEWIARNKMDQQENYGHDEPDDRDHVKQAG
jgi:hypothetical protein